MFAKFICQEDCWQFRINYGSGGSPGPGPLNSGAS